jgi:aspartate beta-hydroxylase
MSAAQNPRVDQFAQAARDTMRAGRPMEAVQLWEQVRIAAPNHPEALFHLGCFALFNKEPARARDLLEQAASADPAAPAIALNLSYAFHALGDGDNELAALDRALVLDPYFFPALLAKGGLVERSGNPRAAAMIYKNVLKIAPPEEELAPDLRSALNHARKVVAENAVATDKYLEARLAAVRSRHKGANFDRFDECKDIALGTKKPYVQQPNMLLVPRLPAIPFYDRDQFPWLAALEAATPDIRREALAVLDEGGADLQPYVSHPDGAPINQWVELNRSPRWSTYFLWKDGVRLDRQCQKCPITAAASEAVPVIDIPSFGPTIMYSVLAPRTKIPPHSSVTNARLVIHLPLVVPDGCSFRVGNETRQWREGEAWVFDDTIEHDASNDSDEYRVILMIDIWNPLLTLAERELIGELQNGMYEYNNAAPVDVITGLPRAPAS